MGLPRVDDVDPVRRAEREKALAARLAAIELEKLDKGKEKEIIVDEHDGESRGYSDNSIPWDNAEGTAESSGEENDEVDSETESERKLEAKMVMAPSKSE